MFPSQLSDCCSPGTGLGAGVTTPPALLFQLRFDKGLCSHRIEITKFVYLSNMSIASDALCVSSQEGDTPVEVWIPTLQTQVCRWRYQCRSRPWPLGRSRRGDDGHCMVIVFICTSSHTTMCVENMLMRAMFKMLKHNWFSLLSAFLSCFCLFSPISIQLDTLESTKI